MHSDGKKRRFALLFVAVDLQRWVLKKVGTINNGIEAGLLG